jgi:phenylpropionate dioxygenase-like ring-hydroxylating dioxygenase large terminal subunit
MQRADLLRFTEMLRAEHAGAPRPMRLPFTIPAARYRDHAWYERERAVVRAAPRIVAVSSEVAPGGCLPIDVPGTSALLTRTPDGTLRAFANACRHRGTRLVDAPCRAKAVTCPYHAWTYDLAGALIHVPHLEAFAGIEPATRGLAELAVSERHGLVWLGADAAAHAEPLDGDLAALGFADHVAYRRARTTRRCNWKLVIEAFLDGYHIRVLHRDSIYRFFLDAASVAEPAGPHIRAATARRALLDAPQPMTTLDDAALRTLATPSYLIFPATVVIAHPDFISVITVHPLAPDVTDWEHLMLIPAVRAGEAEHWARSWGLIEEGVFQREDLWVCEQAQRGLAAGTTDELLFGALEFPVRWFHEALERGQAPVAKIG